MTVNFYIDHLLLGGCIVEWTEDDFKFEIADNGNRRPGLINDKGEARFLTWRNWEVAL